MRFVVERFSAFWQNALKRSTTNEERAEALDYEQRDWSY